MGVNSFPRVKTLGYLYLTPLEFSVFVNDHPYLFHYSFYIVHYTFCEADFPWLINKSVIVAHIVQVKFLIYFCVLFEKPFVFKTN
ncbi:MAG: hypothetical protein KA886_02220 [Candidatus Cloacimonetes bacterium]|nr:hypothetical protein [Candidatus Cloacimonadota bacterium]